MVLFDLGVLQVAETDTANTNKETGRLTYLAF